MTTDGLPPLQDTWTDADGRLVVDAQQDCQSFSFVQRDDVVKFAFTRRFDTCDPQDYVIEVSEFEVLSDTLAISALCLCGT